MRTQLYLCLLLFTIVGCKTQEVSLNLVPTEPGRAPNYWCTWYWQNYLILKGQPVTNPSADKVFTNSAARETMNEENIFGPDGMARVMLSRTCSDFYFLIDHGWQDKSLPGGNVLHHDYGHYRFSEVRIAGAQRPPPANEPRHQKPWVGGGWDCGLGVIPPTKTCANLWRGVGTRELSTGK